MLNSIRLINVVRCNFSLLSPFCPSFNSPPGSRLESSRFLLVLDARVCVCVCVRQRKRESRTRKIYPVSWPGSTQRHGIMLMHRQVIARLIWLSLRREVERAAKGRRGWCGKRGARCVFAGISEWTRVQRTTLLTRMHILLDIYIMAVENVPLVSIFWTDGNVSNDYSGWILRIEVNYENGLFSDEIFRFFRVVGFKNFKIDWNEFSECSISFVKWFDRSEFLREIFLRMIQLIIWKLKTQRCLNVDYILL